jgi:cytochrome c553
MNSALTRGAHSGFAAGLTEQDRLDIAAYIASAK